MSTTNAQKSGLSAAGSSGLRSRVLQHSRLDWVAGIVLAVLAGTIFIIPFFGQRLVQRSYDLPFLFRRVTLPTGIVFVRMDEDSHDLLHQPLGQPFDRNLHAQLLERLKAEGSRTVVFDVVFTRAQSQNPAQSTNGPDAATLRLAAAMRVHGRVVIASHLRHASGEFVKGYALEAPDEVLAKAAAGVGAAEVIADSDTAVRQLLLGLPQEDGSFLPTLAAEAARVEGSQPISAGKILPNNWYLNYYGPPKTIPFKSYSDALQVVEPGFFSNKVVLVGETYPIDLSGVRPDTFSSPFAFWGRFAGAELHATTVENLLHGEWLRRTPSLVEFAFFLFIGALAGAVLPKLPVLRAVALALVLMALLTFGAFELQWHARIWFPWLIPVLVQIPVALLWAILWHALKSYMQTQFLQRSLSLYLSPKRVKAILKHPELLRPGGVEQRISILASDIANFSKISSRMDAEDVLHLLNQYYEEAIGCVHQTDGTVIKLIGDAIFAVWNAPQSQADHQELAARAALALQHKVVQFNQRLDVIPPFGTRVGLHTGQACVGNVGSSTHFDYTAIGQSVNLAFRLESLNKQLKTSILASRDFLKGIDSLLTTRMVGHYRVKGFDMVVEIHEILGLSEQADQSKAWRQTFMHGMHHFHHREFKLAEQAFQETLDLHPDDGPSKFLLAQTTVLRHADLADGWAGEIDLAEK
jgi:adenylate cyclase